MKTAMEKREIILWIILSHGALLSTKPSCTWLCAKRKHRTKRSFDCRHMQTPKAYRFRSVSSTVCVLCKCENSALHNSHSILEIVHVIRCGRNRCTLHLLQTSYSCTPKMGGWHDNSAPKWRSVSVCSWSDYCRWMKVCVCVCARQMV